MIVQRFSVYRFVCGLLGCLSLFAPAAAQQINAPNIPSLQMRISQPNERMELMVNTSRILTMDNKVPKLFVSNPEVLKATPLSPNQVQISGLKPGVTQVNLWDDNGKIFTVDVIVIRDVSELLAVLKSEFPDASLRVRPLAQSIYITGYVPRPEMVDEIIRLSEDYYKNVINGIAVSGVQQVALHVKVIEVSRTKLRELGLDWQFLSDSGTLSQTVGGIMSMGADTIKFSVIGDSASFIGYLDALRRQDLVKLLSEPTLVTMTGRPASFMSGGSFPILVPNGLGTTSVEFRDYGTRVDFVPIIQGNGHIRLEVRPTVSELDEARGVEMMGNRVPALTERSVDTAVEMRAGQTLALAGLIQNRVESYNAGIPFFADLPVVGRAFSTVHERVNEVELLVVVTPEIVSPLEAHEIPQCGPGQLTSSPDDDGLYWHGYVEVPNCCLQGEPTPSQATWEVSGDGPPMHGQSYSMAPNAAPGEVRAQPDRSLLIQPTPNGQNDQLQGSPNQAPAEPRQAAPNRDARRQPRLYGPIGYDPIR